MSGSDIESILAQRHRNGGDHWATPDGRLYVGSPFSTLSSLNMLHELGVEARHEAVAGGLELIFEACREDGRIRLAPKAPLYPCYTAEAARILCRFGHQEHARVSAVVRRFLEDSHGTGGWRCNFTRFGKGPETQFANPGATLFVLDVLRFFPEHREGSVEADLAVESLLDHWETRAPLGPCHYGIGTRFLQVEFPFFRYNLFYYLYVLSFFSRAGSDPRFQDALGAFREKLGPGDEVVVERPHRGLSGLAFCRKGEPSEEGTRRYREILENLSA